MNAKAEKLIKNLKDRQIEAFFVENEDEAKDKVFEIIEKKRTLWGKKAEDVSVSWGGSETLKETGIRNAVTEKYNVLDPYSLPPKEAEEAKRTAILSDIFLMSTNAVCENGEFYNIDGNGNRVASLIYGPRAVIIVVGINKIVKNADEAMTRMKSIACPKNTVRLGKKTPCAMTGKCGDCKIGTETICAHTVITRFSRDADRIKIIIVNKNLGY